MYNFIICLFQVGPEQVSLSYNLFNEQNNNIKKNTINAFWFTYYKDKSEETVHISAI